MELKDYILPLRKWWWLILASVPAAHITSLPLLHLFLSHAAQAQLQHTPPALPASSPLLILFFGRFLPYKGISDLLHAWQRLPPGSARLILAGPGDLALLWPHDLPPGVEVRNRLIPDAEAIALFRSCSLLVLPYIQATQSALIPAAYYFGKPVLAAAAGALPEYILPHQTGWLFSPGDAAALAAALAAILTVTAEDREHLLRLFPSFQQASLAARFTVAPISVDPAGVDRVSHTPQPGKGPLILHLGTMFWPPNVEGVLWFARSVLPLIQQAQPTARFAIIGKNPPPAVQALAADPRIEVTGYLADPSSYLRAAAAFVVPLLAGSGMRVKILDAWLWGIPIVTTSLGAEGIAVRPGENILLADDPAQFAAAVLSLLHDPVLNQRLRSQGRTWIEAHYSAQTIYAQIDALYDRLLSSPPAPKLVDSNQ